MSFSLGEALCVFVDEMWKRLSFLFLKFRYNYPCIVFMKKIKVLTYNLLYGKAFPHLEKIITKNFPDIIGVQEIEERQVKNFPLNKSINFAYELAASSHSFNKFGKNYNIATFYNKKTLKFSSFNYLNLPRNIYEKILYFLKKSPFPRSFISSYFLKDSTKFLHINLHLSPWSTDGAKVRQIKKIFESISSLSLPIIITGDFNFPYGKKRFELLLKEYNLKEATKNLSFTEESKILKIIPVRLKLDYILYRGMKLIKTTRLEKNSSDHYPILAEFEI